MRGLLCLFGSHKFPRSGLTCGLGPCLRDCGHVRYFVRSGSLGINYLGDIEPFEGPPTPGDIH